MAKSAREYLDAAAKADWEKGGSFSSPQRARLFAYRIPFRGTQGTTHTVTYQAEAGEKDVVLTCTVPARGWPHTYNMPAGLAEAPGSVYHIQLPSTVGYVYIRRVSEETASGLRAAVDSYKEAHGWIIDLRGNGGGGYGQSMGEAIAGMPRPVAVIVDAGCMSAGETLARDFQVGAKAKVFGQASAGASSAKRTWTFPSGIASVVIPTRSRGRADGKLIEFNGIEPDVALEADPEEVRAGKNSEILRAEAYFLEQPVVADPSPSPAAGLTPNP